MNAPSLPANTVAWVDFNINSRVRVKLNEKGRAELRKQAEDLMRHFPKLERFDPVMEDEDGWMSFQLWALMEALGHMVYVGSESPFDCRIQFEVPNDQR